MHLRAIFIHSFTYILNLAVFISFLAFTHHLSILISAGSISPILGRTGRSGNTEADFAEGNDEYGGPKHESKAWLGSGEDHGRKRIRLVDFPAFRSQRASCGSGSFSGYLPFSNSLQGKESRDLHLWDAPNPVKWRNISLKPARMRT